MSQFQLTPKGPESDRRFMVVDETGRFITQRSVAKMAQVATERTSYGIVLRYKDKKSLNLAPLEEGKRLQVTVWKHTVEAIDVGDDAALWMQEVLEIPCRVVYMPDSSRRIVNQEYAPRATDEVGFADGYPMLLTTEASLSELNSRLEKSIPMNRFRPNIVLKGTAPFAEDGWKKIRIGTVCIDIVKPCSRCLVIGTDQQTGERFDEPLQTLATYRKREKGIMFGQNCVHESSGLISVGDEVEILL